jgi:hypothetical protein
MREGSVYKRCTCKDADGRRLGARCPKLRRGGSWNPHHGSWGYQLELPPATAAGPRRQLRRSGFARREEAVTERDHARALLALAGTDPWVRTEIANLLAATRPGQRLPDRDTVARRVAAGIPASTTLTVGQHLTEWIDKLGKLAETTDRGYRGHIRLYLVPHLGQVPLQSLRDTHIVAMYTAIRRRDQQILAARASPDPAVRASVKGARTMGAATRQRLLATLRKALNDAVRDKLIDRNPAAIIELDSGERPKPRIWTPRAIQHWQRTGQRPSPVMVWLPEHAGQFLDYTETHDIAVYAMFTLILHRGLRRGEACGLRDFDVDILPDPPDDLRLDCGTMTIAQQITTVGYRPITKKVKSRAGDRIIPLGPATVTVLRDYLRMRERWRQVSGSAWPETGLFFVRPDGQPWHPQPSPTGSSTLSESPAFRPSGCTTCATVPPPTYATAARTSKKFRKPSVTPASP